jgi:hypothetical protein
MGTGDLRLRVAVSTMPWGAIMDKEECETVTKACSEDFEACD